MVLECDCVGVAALGHILILYLSFPNGKILATTELLQGVK